MLPLIICGSRPSQQDPVQLRKYGVDKSGCCGMMTKNVGGGLDVPIRNPFTHISGQ